MCISFNFTQHHFHFIVIFYTRPKTTCVQRCSTHLHVHVPYMTWWCTHAKLQCTEAQAIKFPLKQTRAHQAGCERLASVCVVRCLVPSRVCNWSVKLKLADAQTHAQHTRPPTQHNTNKHRHIFSRLHSCKMNICMYIYTIVHTSFATRELYAWRANIVNIVLMCERETGGNGKHRAQSTVPHSEHITKTPKSSSILENMPGMLAMLGRMLNKLCSSSRMREPPLAIRTVVVAAAAVATLQPPCCGICLARNRYILLHVRVHTLTPTPAST